MFLYICNIDDFWITRYFSSKSIRPLFTAEYNQNELPYVFNRYFNDIQDGQSRIGGF